MLLKVWARVVKTKVSDTLAKSGMVNVVAPTVCAVKAMLTACALVKINGVAAEVAREVAEATPRVGVTRVGLVFITNVEPVPVWAPVEVALPDEVMTPVRLALVVTFPAVNPDAVPVTLVMTPEAGVPRAGVTKVGEVAKTKAPDPVSFEITPRSCREVVAAKTLKLLAVKAMVPARSGKVQVRAPDKSALVIVPVLVPVPSKTVMAILFAVLSLSKVKVVASVLVPTDPVGP